jgi:outer membrane protein assembly factor BamE (lipoprotein component of BamABCDE complex)
MRLHIAVAMLCVAFTLAGCLFVPVPPVPGVGQGRAIDDDLVSAIKVGSTTREEVLASWGEPTGKIWGEPIGKIDDDELRYSW